MHAMMKICGKTEKEIITKYELFAKLIEGIFGRSGNLNDHIFSISTTRQTIICKITRIT